MKLCIIGAFGFDRIAETTGGQPAKTRQLYYTLTEHYGAEAVSYIETYGWKSHPLRMLRSVLREAKGCDGVIMLPAHNGVMIFSRLLAFCKKRYGTRIFYDVIGGWLAEKTAGDRGLSRCLREFDGIWVETRGMKDALETQGFRNVPVVPNFRKMEILTEDGLVYPEGKPLRFCTFSRVMKEKGIEDAVDAVNNVNAHFGYPAVSLDIYGPVDETQAAWFEQLKAKMSGHVSYKGCVEPSESGSVLKAYFCLLFPTRFYTEGIPGTIIDAYAAGVPVISARWKGFGDVVEEGVTGMGYGFEDTGELLRLLVDAVNAPDTFNGMKKHCLRKARAFHAETAVELLAGEIERRAAL